MSGTSLDGIDLVLCEINDSNYKLISSLELPFNKELKREILKIIGATTTLKEIGIIDNKLGNLFADAINLFIQRKNIDSSKITAVGLHGQTLWHHPNTKHPFSMQLGSPNIVSAKTGLRVVADFRGMDIANGGQGAPFAPAFHKFIFSSLKENVAVLNIGGMANITILGKELKGWDSGCGNILLDMWVAKCKNKSYDKDGKFAKSGMINKALLNAMLDDNYFKKLPPKSTGREYFNDLWLKKYLKKFKNIKDEDVQATLVELTAKSIADDIKKTKTDLLIVCGGGAKNTFLMQRLQKLCKIKVAISDEYGVSADFMEAMTFAWLAHKRVHREKVALSSVTGAKKDSILGAVYG